MEIPINVRVYCADGDCGRSTRLIVNPVTRAVTHLVVRERDEPHTERLVALKWIDRTTLDMILLSCTRERLSKMSPFVVTRFLREALPDYEHPAESHVAWPYRVSYDVKTVQVQERRVPPHELEVTPGTRVRATDGEIGHVNEFLVDPQDSHITHLVLREGRLWGQKDVAIPISEIQHFDGEAIKLKLDKRGVGALPAIRIKRP